MLRFIAALAVVVYHYAPRAIATGIAVPSPVVSASSFGYLGVELFFVISGCVITLSASDRTARAFLVNRAVRLYPTFWAALLFTVVMQIALVPGSHFSSTQLLANLAMLPGYLGEKPIDDVYWTLSVEWKFYALVAAALTMKLSRHSERIACVWILLLATQHLLPRIGWLSSLTIFPYGSHFAFGVLLLAVRQHGASPPRIAWAFVAMAVCVATTAKVHGGFVPGASASSKVVACSISGGSCLLLLLSARYRQQPAVAARLQALGSSTYPLYLLHAGVFYPVLSSLSAAGFPPASALMTTLVTMSITVYIFSRYMERGLVPYLSKTMVVGRIAGHRRFG